MFFQDNDGDGFGSASSTQSDCIPPTGYVAISGDCDDTRPDVFPNATLQDGRDANCDGLIDYDVDGNGTSDRSTLDFAFNPLTQRHIELEQVVEATAFAVDVHDSEIDRAGINLVATSPFAKALTWDAATGKLAGKIHDPGVYRFPISVCTKYPYNAAACQDPANQRLDLAHLTVRPRKPLQVAADPAPKGPYQVAISEVVV
ncbi:MAG: hypothetical protein ACKVP3_27510, partial [Hyphomicrobiaceae bacterium]